VEYKAVGDVLSGATQARAGREQDAIDPTR